jgi:hypothetical protein
MSAAIECKMYFERGKWGPSMNVDTLSAALGALAQVAGTLAALIGFLGLWRLDRLKQEREQVERDLRGLLISPRFNVQELMTFPTERILQEAQTIAGAPLETLSLTDQRNNQARLQEILRRWYTLPGKQQQLMWVLQRFLRRALVILVLAIICLTIIDWLSAWVVTRWLLWLLIMLAGIRLWRDMYAVMREAARSLRE